MQKEIEVAVNWWAEILMNKGSNHDNGNIFQSNFANRVASRHNPLTEEQIESFKIALTKRLEEMSKFDSHIIIGVDYGPDLILRESTKEAGFEFGLRFPIKTVMWIKQNSVEVSRGYRAQPEKLL